MVRAVHRAQVADLRIRARRQNRLPQPDVLALAYGWSVAKAKHVYKPGRGNWLVRWREFSKKIAA